MTMNKDGFKVWMVRAGRGSFLIEEFLKKEIIAIGWNEIDAISEHISYDDLKEILINIYPDWSQGKLNQSASQIWKFYNEFSVGDKVITYDSDARVYYTGEIKSEYGFSDKFEYKHYRNVNWNDFPIERDYLRVESKNTLGSILTIFELHRTIWTELVELHPGFVSDEELEEIQKHFEAQELEQLKEDAIFRSLEFIKDIITTLNWEEMEKLAAGLMRGMGYKTRMTTKGGGDLGSDIIASPDGLAMVEPIIKVEVKHKIKSKEKVSAPDLRGFIGGLRTTSKGIYISSTGFTKEAHYEAERANFQVTLIDLDLLVELIVEYYESLDSETRALVPLRKIYWPI